LPGLQETVIFSSFNLQEDIAHEAETGKIYRADYKDKLGRTVLVMRPGLEVSCFAAELISGNIFIIRFLDVYLHKEA
jgi:hypothetical protein